VIPAAFEPGVGDDERMPDDVPPELLLEGYPEPTRELARQLRAAVRQHMPDAVERVRAGWRIIGYDLKVGRKSAFFAWVMPQVEHVHLGFPYGVFMADPERRMDGAGITKRARWLTFEPGTRIDAAGLKGIIREAARVTGMSPSERFAVVLEREDETRD
jgi:hypothetical protein